MMKHVRQKHHELTKAEMDEIGVDTKTKLIGGTVSVGDEERAHVALGSDTFHFKCIQCDAEYSKRNVMRHFKQPLHQDQFDCDKLIAVSKWITTRDGNLIKNSRPGHNLLEFLMGGSTVDDDENAEDAKDAIEAEGDAEEIEGDAEPKEAAHTGPPASLAGSAKDAPPTVAEHVVDETVNATDGMVVRAPPTCSASSSVAGLGETTTEVASSSALAVRNAGSGGSIMLGSTQQMQAQAVFGAFQEMLKRFDSLDSKVGPQESKVREQTIVLREETKAWKRPENWNEVARHNWFLAEDEWKDPEFRTWLQSRSVSDKASSATCGNSAKSDTMRGLARFKGMFKTDTDEPIDEAGFLVNLVRSRTMLTLMSTEAFSDDLDFTNKALRVMGQLRQYQWEKFRHERDDRSIEYLELLTESSMKVLRRGVGKHKKTAEARKLHYDYLKIDDFASPEKTKIAVRNAMIDLELIVQSYQDQDTMPASTRLRATQLALFIIYYNGFGGRPMEWQKLKRNSCLKQLLQHPDMIEMSDFKTSSTYIVVAKGIAEGTYDAIVAFASLPSSDGKEEELLFPPTPLELKMTHKLNPAEEVEGESANDQRYCQVAKSLARAVNLVLKGHDALSPTNLRKQLHTKTGNEEVSEDFKLLCRLDTHSVQVANSNYDMARVRSTDLAKRGQKLFFKYMGEPVAYPSLEEVKASGRSVELMLKRNYNIEPTMESIPAPLPGAVKYRSIVKKADGTYAVEGKIPKHLLAEDDTAPVAPIAMAKKPKKDQPIAPRPGGSSEQGVKPNKHFNPVQVQWLLQEHSKLSCWKEGEKITRVAARNYLFILITKGIKEKILDDAHKDDHQIDHHLRNCLRIQIENRHPGDADKVATPRATMAAAPTTPRTRTPPRRMSGMKTLPKAFQASSSPADQGGDAACHTEPCEDQAKTFNSPIPRAPAAANANITRTRSPRPTTPFRWEHVEVPPLPNLGYVSDLELLSALAASPFAASTPAACTLPASTTLGSAAPRLFDTTHVQRINNNVSVCTTPAGAAPTTTTSAPPAELVAAAIASSPTIDFDPNSNRPWPSVNVITVPPRWRYVEFRMKNYAARDGLSAKLLPTWMILGCEAQRILLNHIELLFGKEHPSILGVGIKYPRYEDPDYLEIFHTRLVSKGHSVSMDDMLKWIKAAMHALKMYNDHIPEDKQQAHMRS
jgi:hypothetical protein